MNAPLTPRSVQSFAPEVTVIVPSYNSAAVIAQCLDSLQNQITEFRYEVVVVDSSDDGTGDMIRRDFPWVRLIQRAQQTSCGLGRNIGVAATSAPYVLFTDTDCVAAPDWIEVMAGLLQNGSDAVSGAMANGTPASITGTVGYLLEFFRFIPFEGAPRDTQWIVGGNSGFRREVLERFDYPDANLGDDFRFSYDLRQTGHRLNFAPRALVRHLNRTGYSRVWAYQVKIGAAAVDYRSVSSASVMAWFLRAPVLIWASIPVVYVWVGATVASRQGVVAVLRYLLMTPVTVSMIFGWALGFFRAARRHGTKA